MKLNCKSLMVMTLLTILVCSCENKHEPLEIKNKPLYHLEINSLDSDFSPYIWLGKIVKNPNHLNVDGARLILNNSRSDSCIQNWKSFSGIIIQDWPIKGIRSVANVFTLNDEVKIVFLELNLNDCREFNIETSMSKLRDNDYNCEHIKISDRIIGSQCGSFALSQYNYKPFDSQKIKYIYKKSNFESREEKYLVFESFTPYEEGYDKNVCQKIENSFVKRLALYKNKKSILQFFDFIINGKSTDFYPENRRSRVGSTMYLKSFESCIFKL